MTKYEPIGSPDATTLFPYHDLTPPTTKDVFRARSVIRQYLPSTPLVRSEFLSNRLDADVYLKREDTLPTGAFKVRGGINLCYHLNEEFREQGVISASTGNHGQSIAYAGREFGYPVTIVVPDNPNPDKVRGMRRMGASIIEHGDDYEAARELAESKAAEYGFRYIHSGNESHLIAGVGTAGIEVLNDLPDVDVVVCPVGGGSSASGYCLTVGQLTDADVIGVQSESADAVHRAWRTGQLVPNQSADTFAEGIASRVPFALPVSILRKELSEFSIVSEDAICKAIYDTLREESLLIEGATGAAVAGALELGDQLAGRTVVIQISGRNISTEKLTGLLTKKDSC